MCTVLYRAHLDGTPYMDTQEIFHQINEILSEDGITNLVKGDKISDIFKSNREASAALIKRKGQSHYCLKLNQLKILQVSTKHPLFLITSSVRLVYAIIKKTKDPNKIHQSKVS